ncbi:hypothetical protein ACFL5O_11505 [Myxococcota bacterium]
MGSGSDKSLQSTLRRSLAALQQQSDTVDLQRKALIGYSLGASAALRAVTVAQGEWSGLMLVNAGLEPNATVLRAAGVKRVALVAGERDLSSPKLQRAAKRLLRGQVDARFFSLAATGHYFDASSEQRLLEPLLWLRERL